MGTEFGPYRQMITLAEQMAKHFQMDANLELRPHLSHYMEEVEVNISADAFNHVGFMDRILTRLQTTLAMTREPRAREFLNAAVLALQARIDRQQTAMAPDASMS